MPDGGGVKLMKINMNVRLGFMVAMVAVSASMSPSFRGHPMWPPRRHSAEYRQANMLFLRFQDALAAERWQEALSLCSDRVRARAAEWPSPRAFFHETFPTELLLAQDFGDWTLRADQTGGFDWTDKANFYALFINLTEPESNPCVQWHWAISATNHEWVVDDPPVKLEEYLARHKAAIQQREDKIKRIRESLEPKALGVKAHLIPVSDRFIIGSPMLFRVEITNRGPVAVDYRNSGVAYVPLTVLDEKGRVLPGTRPPSRFRFAGAKWSRVRPWFSRTEWTSTNITRSASRANTRCNSAGRDWKLDNRFPIGGRIFGVKTTGRSVLSLTFLLQPTGFRPSLSRLK